MSGEADAYRSRVIRQAVLDALALRRELEKHDIPARVRERMMITAIPALLEIEHDLGKEGA